MCRESCVYYQQMIRVKKIFFRFAYAAQLYSRTERLKVIMFYVNSHKIQVNSFTLKMSIMMQFFFLCAKL